MEEDVFDMWSQDDESIIKKKKKFSLGWSVSTKNHPINY